MDTIKFLTNIGRSYGEVILGILLGVFLGSYFSMQNGAVVSAIGVLVCASRTLILEWYKREFGEISEMYELNKKISENQDADFIREAKMCENMLINKLRELSNGILTYDDIGDYLKAAGKGVKNTKNIKATALINPNEWKEDGELGSYLREQFNAIEKREIKITRIFFLTEGEKKNKNIMNILKEQSDKGIEVRIAKRELYHNSVLPFVIYDDKVALVGTLDGNLKITNGCKKTNMEEVRKLLKQFNDIYIKSEPLNSEPSKPKSLKPKSLKPESLKSESLKSKQ